MKKEKVFLRHFLKRNCLDLLLGQPHADQSVPWANLENNSCVIKTMEILLFIPLFSDHSSGINLGKFFRNVCNTSFFLPYVFLFKDLPKSGQQFSFPRKNTKRKVVLWEEISSKTSSRAITLWQKTDCRSACG